LDHALRRELGFTDEDFADLNEQAAQALLDEARSGPTGG
jgi:hypothetical protein